jgi:hypothetical protein
MTAPPVSPNSEMMDLMKGKAPEVYFVGDCGDPRFVAEATASGALTASSI